jgi:hypothetical protein
MSQMGQQHAPGANALDGLSRTLKHEMVDRAVLSLKDAGVPSFLIE